MDTGLFGRLKIALWVAVFFLIFKAGLRAAGHGHFADDF